MPLYDGLLVAIVVDKDEDEDCRFLTKLLLLLLDVRLVT